MLYERPLLDRVTVLKMSETVTDKNKTHEPWEALVALHALDGLPPEEESRVEGHLVQCATCQQRLADYRQVADHLAATIPVVQAPHELEARLRAEVRPVSPPLSLPARRQPWQQPAWWVAAAALLVALLVGTQNVALRRELATVREEQAAMTAALVSPEAQPILLRASTGDGAGRFVWAPGNPVASLVVEGLPPNQPYHLWLIREDGTIDSGGRFRADAYGRAQLTVPAPAPWPSYETLLISDTPPGSRYEAETDIFLEGEF